MLHCEMRKGQQGYWGYEIKNDEKDDSNRSCVDVYDTVHLVIGNLAGEEQAEQILNALKIDKEKGYTGKEDFAGESTEDFSDYTYFVSLFSDGILINAMAKDHPSVSSQIYGYQD